MLKEAMQFLLTMGSAEEFEFGDRKYTDKKLHEVKPPRAEVLKINTLTGFVDYAKNMSDEDRKKAVITVEDHTSVWLLSTLHSDWMDRDSFAHASTGIYDCNYPFGEFISQENFLIKLQSQFVQDQETEKLQSFCGSVKSEAVQTSDDDGVTQKVQTSSGIHLSKMSEVPNPVSLKPFRTFPEIEQPESKFVLRARNGKARYEEEKGVQFALFEADGGAWKQKAILDISAYLQNQLPNFRVIA